MKRRKKRIRIGEIERIKEAEKRKVIITTQLIEAGVDISVDKIYRDFAPLDSIIQTAGRCNRNNKSKMGEVTVVRLTDERNTPYCSYIYDSTLREISEEVIKSVGSKSTEKEFNQKGINHYYRLTKKRGRRKESRTILKAVERLKFSKTSKFRLIEEDLPTVSLILEENKQVRSLRRKIEDLAEEKGFEKRGELLKLKREIAPYTLSIKLKEQIKKNLSSLPPVGNLDALRYVPRDECKYWYKKDVGFQVSKHGEREARIL